MYACVYMNGSKMFIENHRPLLPTVRELQGKRPPATREAKRFRTLQDTTTLPSLCYSRRRREGWWELARVVDVYHHKLPNRAHANVCLCIKRLCGNAHWRVDVIIETITSRGAATCFKTRLEILNSNVFKRQRSITNSTQYTYRWKTQKGYYL